MEELFPYLHNKDDNKLSNDQLFLLRLELDKCTSKIKRTFAEIVYDLQKGIEKSSNVNDLVNVLKFFDDEKFGELLSGCSSIALIFEKLSPYFRFFDFEIVKLLTKKLGSDYNKIQLTQYRKMFKEFSKQRVYECPKDAFGDVKETEKFFAIKTDKHIESLMIKDLCKLKYEICQALGFQLQLLMATLSSVSGILMSIRWLSPRNSSKF